MIRSKSPATKTPIFNFFLGLGGGVFSAGGMGGSGSGDGGGTTRLSDGLLVEGVSPVSSAMGTLEAAGIGAEFKGSED